MAKDDTSEVESYERRSAVLVEIEKVLARPPASWVALANTPESKGGLSSEALVHLVRHLRARPEAKRVLGELIVALDRRVTRVVARWARGFDDVTSEEIALEVGCAILELCLGQGSARAADFLEASFATGVKRRTLDAVDLRKHAAKPGEVAQALRKAERSGEPDASQEGDPDADAPKDAGPIDRRDPERALLAAEDARITPEAIRAALGHVRDPRHREAVILHHLEGWPITDQDPDVDTVCKRFGVSDRQIRNWIEKAFAQMRKAIGNAP